MKTLAYDPLAKSHVCLDKGSCQDVKSRFIENETQNISDYISYDTRPKIHSISSFEVVTIININEKQRWIQTKKC